MQERYDLIQSRFVSGDLEGAADQAQQAAPDAAASGSLWAAKFLLQEARIKLYQGKSREALTLLTDPSAVKLTDPVLSAMHSSMLAIAYVRLHDFTRAEESLRDTAMLCHDEASRSQLHLAEGAVAVELNKLNDAEQAYTLGLASALASGDRFAQTQHLLGLAVVALRQDHYEDALQRFEAVSTIARTINARQALEKAEGSAGKTRYRIGDLPHALLNAKAAEEAAKALGSTTDEARWLIDIGLIYYRMGNLEASRVAVEKAYGLARSIQNDEETVDALIGMALISLRENYLQQALEKAREAEQVALQRGERSVAFEPTLLEAQALSRQGRLPEAREKLLGMLTDPDAEPRPFEKWQIESTLARLAGAAGDQAAAAQWSQRSIETFRSQRQMLSQAASRLPFSENGAELYRDYMEQLLQQGKTADALAVLDRSRVETLTEGSPEETWSKDPTAVARRLHGTILVYCLRPQTSYLWAIAPKKMAFFRLPSADVLQVLVQRHTQSILSGRDISSQANSAGMQLYQELVAPAQNLIAPGGKVFVIADGDLERLNFETLPLPGERTRFWIEDADVINAKSLSLLARRTVHRSGSPAAKSKLLLVGDPVYKDGPFEKLPQAAQEVANVANHFSQTTSLILTGADATRHGYLASRPGDFRFIHFVAHATASESNPLDSAVVLSQERGEPASYRLYARDIMNSKIQADLVTISACYGSGVRTYAGEGLVGLAWAFLRAGSHNVIGALWDVSDVSTPQLMNELYDGLAAGRSPDEALRSAKLAMIARGGVFQKPFYWAAFQLYTGA